MKEEKDVIGYAIRDKAIQQAIVKTFEDGLLLTSDFTIVAAGEKVLRLLGYQKEELHEFVISRLTMHHLNKELKSGYFDGIKIEIPDKTRNYLSCTVSGFYLSLIASIPDQILLIIKSDESVELLPKQTSRGNLDEFIYSASHSLRGPLATLKGLINLLELKMAQEWELEFIYTKMKILGDHLDELLHKLIFYAESDKSHEFSAEEVTLNEIGKRLRSYQEWDNAIHHMSFADNLNAQATTVENGGLILALLQNVRSFFYSVGSTDCEINFNGITNESFFEFEFKANGVTLSAEQKKKIEVVNFGYTEILNEPQLTHLYSAKKIVLKLNGRLHLSLANREVFVYLFVPKKITDDKRDRVNAVSPA
jgi:hypothetical protein